jgi:hypothetical protein
MPIITEGGASNLGLTIPLVKLDVERRLVIGRAAQAVPDKTREIMDYATGKVAFQEWSAKREEESGGLSKGNVRVMHSRVAAGKVIDLTYNDAEQAVDVVAHIVDNNEWEKCLKGVYTGFSIGGGYAAKWKDGELTRYTPKITELSLVDSPCIPTARFAELVKADGIVEQLELRGAPPRTFAALIAEMAPKDPPPITFGALRKRAEAQQGLTFAALRKVAPRTSVTVATEPSCLPFARGATDTSG